MNTTFVRHTHTHTHSSLVPRPPPFFALWFAFSIIHGSGRARKMGKAWSHPSCVWTWGGHREEGPNHKHNALVHLFKRSTAVLDVKTLAWSKLLIFTSKKIALRVYSYIVEYWLLPLTSLSRPPRIHLMSYMTDETRPSRFFVLFHFHVLYWTQTEEQKMGEAWERGYTHSITTCYTT